MERTPSLMFKRGTVDVRLGGRLGREGKYRTVQKKRTAHNKASASINVKMSLRNSRTLPLGDWVKFFAASGSRTMRGPSRNPPALPSWLNTLLIPVAVVLSLGGNLIEINRNYNIAWVYRLRETNYHREERAGGTAQSTIPATPFKLAPVWAIQVKKVSFIDIHLIAVPHAISKALIIIPTRNPALI